MSDELTLKAISAYHGNLHNGMTAALEAVVAMVLEEAAKVAESYDGPGMESVPDAIWGDAQATKDDIAYYIRALKDKP